MKPTVTIDLEEYNELKRRSQELALGVKTTTFSVKKMRGNDTYVSGVDYVPSRYTITDSLLLTNDDAVNAIAEELKKTQNRVNESSMAYEHRLNAMALDCSHRIKDVNEKNKEKIASIKKMSLFQFYRFKNNK